MTHELYHVHRPKTLKQLIGQESAVQTLRKMKSIPHAILLSGPSGCGKTTVARILKSQLEVSDHDFTEINSADFRGIDMVRDIRARMAASPMQGKHRMWLLDEVHQLTSASQNGLLKLLEDTPPHVYFVLATTEPNSLLKTVITRCTHIQLKTLTNSHLRTLLENVSGKEKVTLPDEVLEKIVDSSEGSARKALVILNQVLHIGDEDSQLAAIDAAVPSRQAIEIARLLMNPRSSWPDMIVVLKSVDEEPESLRYMILGYCTSILLSTNAKQHARAAFIIECFSDNFFYSKKAGLVAACYDVVKSK
jgi:DNA polymerase III gamma/tau subunit